MAVEPEASARTSGWPRSIDSSRSGRRSSRRSPGSEVKPLYTEEDRDGSDPERDLGYPGEFPYTRGVYPSMYRGRLWTMRQFAGFGTAEETNERFHYLLDHGQTGLSTAFDMPTLMGLDSDAERSLGEVGVEGVAIDTLDDMETLFDGIDLGKVTTSMTINAPAAILLAFYVATAEEQGVPPERLGGTIQTDILKEYIAQKEWCFPIEPAMRLVGDMIEWCTEHMPRWHPISISGYHIREAGSTAQQELAFTLKDGFTYVEQAIERGLDVDAFAPRLSFFFNAHIDFFEEIAKYRAARRIWAREMRDTYGAKRDGVTADALPHPDRRRLADRAAAAGQHHPHGDRGARRRARRDPVAAHQLLRRGSRPADRGGGPDRPAHPAGDRPRDRRHQHDRPARRLLLRRDAHRRDGARRLRVLRPDRRARRAWSRRSSRTSRSGRSPTHPSATSRRSTRRQRIVVGRQRLRRRRTTRTIPILRIDPELERKQKGRVEATKARRDSAEVERTLGELRSAAATDANLMPPDPRRAPGRGSRRARWSRRSSRSSARYTELPVF